MGGAVTVLYIDAESASTAMATRCLDRDTDRITVETARSAETGLERFENTAFDCIVSDYHLPGQNGIELLETIRESHSSVPFILFPANGNETLAAEAIEAGVDSYLPKETSTDQYAELTARIRDHVEQYRERTRADRLTEEHALVTEAATDVFWVVDVPTGDQTFSDGLQEFGYDPATTDPSLEWWYERLHPDDRDRIRNKDDALFEREEAVFDELTDDRGWFSNEYRWQRADGTYADCRERGLVLFDDGEPTKMVGTITDITERKNWERGLQRQKAKIEALHEVATDLETCRMPEAVYERIVEAAEAILEFDVAIADAVEDERLVPMAVSSELSTDQYYDETPIDADDNCGAEAYRTGDSSVVADLQSHDVAPADPAFRSVLTVPIGEYGIFQTVAEAPNVFDEDDLELAELLVAHARAQLAHLDREQQLRERTERLQRQNERLDEFASVVSHDLRGPLTVAKGHLELARETSPGEELDVAVDALDRMEALIEDLLALAREGVLVNDTEPVDLAAIADRCWQTIAPAAATLVADTDRMVCADQSRLRQLLENLLRNAIDHGRADVTVTIGDLDDGAGFYVADDGPGIPEAEREQVLETGYSTSDDGTGFGLAIVEKIVEAHGWEINVTDSEDNGAQFEITGVESPTE